MVVNHFQDSFALDMDSSSTFVLVSQLTTVVAILIVWSWLLKVVIIPSGLQFWTASAVLEKPGRFLE